MTEVRAGVDALDEQIVALVAKRFQFMDAAARIKQTRKQIRDEVRKAAILERVGLSAANAGAPADLIVRLYDGLIETSISYELAKFDRRLSHEGPD